MAYFNHLEPDMKGIKFIFVIIISLIYASLLMGCGGASSTAEPAERGETAAKRPSPAPVAADHAAFLQLVEQAGEHWRDLAVEVAERVLKAYEDRPDLLERPIFIVQPNNRPFSVAFYNLLRTELVSRGLQVSYKQEERSTLLEYTVQTVPFDRSRMDYALKHGKAKASDNEIIVNARMSYRNRFVMHASSIRYINEADIALYMDPQVYDPMATSSRNIRVTDK